MLREIDPLLRVNESGVIIKEGEENAWMVRLEEWLRTPVGSVWGLPHWGNPIAEFKHEPIGEESTHVDVAIENRLATKLRSDLPGLGLQAIRCEALSQDQVLVSFYTRNGSTNTVLQKSK
jgi:hypothetical protein